MPPPCSPRSSEKPRHFLDEQRHAAGARGDVLHHVARQRVAGGKFRHHVAHLCAIERRQRDGAVMRAHAPGRAEFRPRRRHDKQRRQRAALGDAAQDIERGRIGPMQILERQHHRLNLRARHHPVGQRRQLPAPQFLRRQSRRAFLGQRNVEERRQQGSVLRRIELDLSERTFQLGEPPLGGHVGAAETQAAPFGDRMQRRVLQKLRAAPFDPGVRRFGEPGMKFLDQPRFAEPRLADDHAPVGRRPGAPAPSAAAASSFRRRGRRAA